MKKILLGLMLFCASSVSIAQIPSDVQATINGYYPLQVNLTLERGRLNKNFAPISKKASKVQYRMTYNPQTLQFEKRK